MLSAARLDRLRSFAEREAERTRVAAALAQKHAALNILARDRLSQTLDAYMAAGLKPKNAILALMEGTQRPIEGGRHSAAALRLAYETRYAGGMMAQISKEIPHFKKLLRDEQFDADIAREMAELREGGTPVKTGNADAQKAARIFAKYAELSRTDANRLGGSIGKLDGWAGPQIHDDLKLIRAGKQAWTDAILSELDVARTFEDLTDLAEIREALGDMFDTIVTGFPNKTTAAEKGQRVNPANLAKSLGKSRVLHFKDADTALAYRDEFGAGNTVSGIWGHLRRVASVTAQMEMFGPNPEVMVASLIDGMARKIKKNPNQSDATKAKQIAALKFDPKSQAALRQAFSVMSGLTTRPENVTAAKIAGDIRAVESMAKLGGAVLTSIPSDTVTAAIASQYRGSGFWRGLFDQLDGVRQGRPKGEVEELTYLIGEGFDGLIGQIVSPHAAQDGLVGMFSRLQKTFFKYNGLSWFTDLGRGTAGRMVAAEMGMRAKTAHGKLPAVYRDLLGVHGIGEAEWNAIRTAEIREVNGRSYITPDSIRDVDEAAIEPLVRSRLDAARAASKVDEAKGAETLAKRQAAYEEQAAKILDDGRRQLELKMAAFVADEVNYAVIETDARSQRTTTMGHRRGTFMGEAIRFVMQFKAFPVAFLQRVGGRTYGHVRYSDAAAIDKATHVGTIVAGLAIAGYMSIVMKDLTRGYWPPRDPTDYRTWIAAFQQGGAAGIYGDYLFGQVSRFGNTPLETVAGPTVGAASSLLGMAMRARDASLSSDEEFKYGELISFGAQNTPFANLFYFRPALDYLVLNGMREAASPGYLQRQETRRFKEYGQRSLYTRDAGLIN